MTQGPASNRVKQGTVPWKTDGKQDLFGNRLVSMFVNQVEVHLDNTNWASFVDITSAGSGAAAQANGQVTFSTGATAVSRYVAISKDAVVYHPNHECGWGFTWTFPTVGTATCYSRIGATDDTSWTNSVFFGYETATPTALTLTYRRGGAQIFSEPQANWIDPCDGSAGSLYTDANGNPVALDPTKDQLARVRAGLFGHAGFIVELYSPDTSKTPEDRWVLIYIYTGINGLAVPVFTNFELKIAADVNKSAGADNVQVASACWAGFTTCSLQRVSDAFSSRSLVQPTVSIIRGLSTAGGGTYVDVKVSPSGAVQVGGEIAPITGTTGGATPFRNAAVTNTAVAVKASAGKVWWYNIHNPGVALAYLHFYDVAAASVTVGVTVPTLSLALPSIATASVALDAANAVGIQFSTAISVAATTTPGGAVAPGTALVVNAGYS